MQTMSPGAGMGGQTNTISLGSRTSVSSTGSAVHHDRHSPAHGQNEKHEKTTGSSSFDAAPDTVLHACSNCPATFTRHAHLRRHEASVHNFDNPKHYRCGGCRKNLSRRDVLIRHYQTCPAVKANATLSDKEPRRKSRNCQSCHELKLQCSGEPVCTKCGELGLECVSRQRARTGARKDEEPLNPWPSPTTDRSTEASDIVRQGDSTDAQRAPEAPATSRDKSASRSEAGVTQADMHKTTTAGRDFDPGASQIIQSVLQQNKPHIITPDMNVQSHIRAHPHTSLIVSGELTPKRGKKRGRYVASACLNCKSQKVKCSGEDVCARCRSNDVECIYDRQRNSPRQKRRRILSAGATDHENDDITVKSPSMLAKVLERIEKLERDHNAFRVYMSEWSNALDDHSRRVDDDGDISDSSATSTSSMTSLASNNVLHRATSLFEPIRVLNQTVVGDEEQQEGEQEQHESPEQSQESFQPQVAWLSLTRRGNKGIKVLEKETRMRDPTELHQSVDLYFSHLNPHYPCLNENQFRAQMEVFYTENTGPCALPSGDRYQFAALLNLLHAEAKILANDCLDSGGVPGWEEFCCAEGILNQIVWLGNGNVWTVQCLIVKARYLLYIERADSAYDTITQVVRLCIQLGLNNQDSWRSCTPFETVMRQRLFWSVYYLERNIALNCGAPYLLRESEFKVDLPPDLDDGLMFAGQPLPKESPGRSPGPFLKAIAQWGKLSDEIWDKLFSLHVQKPTSRELVAALDARILYVAGELPVQLQFSSHTVTQDASDGTPWYISNQAFVLSLHFNQLRLFLRQESMLSLKYTAKTAEDSTTIATSSINAIHDRYNSSLYHPVHRSAAVLYLVGALLPLVCIICKKENAEKVRSDAIDAFKKGITILNRMYPNFGNARHALRRLHRITASTMRAIREFQKPDSEMLATNVNDLAMETYASDLPEFFHFDPWLHSRTAIADQQLQINSSLPYNFAVGARSEFHGSMGDGFETGQIESMLNDYEMLF